MEGVVPFVLSGEYTKFIPQAGVGCPLRQLTTQEIARYPGGPLVSPALRAADRSRPRTPSPRGYGARR